MSQKGEAYSIHGAFLLDSAVRRWLQPPYELIEKLNIRPNDVVMDFGCGPGFFTIDAAKKAKKVLAVDLAAEMLRRAQKKAEKAGAKNIEFLQSDGTKIDVEDGYVDLIFLVTVFHEIGESGKVLAEFQRILKRSGRLVIVEIIKKGHIPGAPVQNPEVLKAEVEAVGFRLGKIEAYKNYGMLFFEKDNS